LGVEQDKSLEQREGLAFHVWSALPNLNFAEGELIGWMLQVKRIGVSHENLKGTFATDGNSSK
jgi:hypothetical protein